MGFGTLRVINDDVIDPDSGFDLHPHDNMEIITMVMRGAVTHGDSMGNDKVVPAGDVQVMSAGTGVVHSEYNRSIDTPLELFQIWIYPRERGVAPHYDQRSYGTTWTANALQLIVSPDGRDDSLSICQDAFVLRGMLESGHSLSYDLHDSAHGLYVFVVDGSLTVDGQRIDSHDAIGVTDIRSIVLSTDIEQGSRFILFEVPMDR